MPRFAPFAGLRYDPTRVEPTKVVAPPYDVVGPAERAELAARHSANAILVELPEPDPRSGADRYAAAAARLAAWRSDGILRRDPAPGFYVYRMTAPDGSVTLGVLGELGIEPGSIEDVLPHEETLAKAKSDRLELLGATRVNLSPIWGLSLATGLTGLLATDGPPTVTAVDDDGVRHELWLLDDPETVDAVADLVGSAPVVVADGHHRLATAIYLPGGRRSRYARRRRDPGPGGRTVRGRPHRRADPPGAVGAPRRTRPGGRLHLVVRRGPGR